MVKFTLSQHWFGQVLDTSRVPHICVSKLNSIGSDNGLPPGRHQANIWTKAGIFLIWLLEANFSDVLIEI